MHRAFVSTQRTTVALALLLTGCVTTYRAPTDGVPMAEIVFTAHEPSVSGRMRADFLLIDTFEDRGCSQSKAGTRIVAMKGLGKKNKETFKGTRTSIAAGREFVFSMYHYAGIYGSRSCVLTFGFTPKEGGSYLAYFTRETDTCEAIITDNNSLPIPGLQEIRPPCIALQ